MEISSWHRYLADQGRIAQLGFTGKLSYIGINHNWEFVSFIGGTVKVKLQVTGTLYFILSN